MKNLKDLIKHLNIKKYVGDTNQSISKIEIDSRLCVKHCVFIAIKGYQVDGHSYISKAIELGASTIICEVLPEQFVEGVCYLRVSNTSKVLSQISAAFYDFPSEKMNVVGVTGTNGKTTTATLLFDLFTQMGEKVGLISTISYHIGLEVFPSTHTTPNAIRVQELFRKMVDHGCTTCFMEVSSHALDQNRVFGVDFDIAVFTNISRDHLDYHKNYNHYISSKKLLFDGLKPEAYALINLDDKHGETMLLHTKAKSLSYALHQVADYKTRALEFDLNGSLITINQTEVFVQLIGEHNLYNATVCYAVAELLGKEPFEILTRLSILKTAKGRFEQVRSKSGKTAIVDYAHTPDALENVLKAIHDIKPKEGKIITVVGCGGDRDKGKRPMMAKIALQYSDQAIFTADNPRSEDPDLIIADMEAGVPSEKLSQYLSIADRRSAIRTALKLTSEKDVVLIAGKGHEDYQIIKGEKLHFDDVEEVEAYFKLIEQN